jgi:hypothetical protein
MRQRQLSKTTRVQRTRGLAEALDPSVESRPSVAGVLFGKFIGQSEQGEPLVDLPYPGFRDPVAARSVTVLPNDAVGRIVAVVFEQGDPRKPLVMGFLQGVPIVPPIDGPRPEVMLDGERLTFAAEREIVLRCGKASITLTRDGKVLIRGAYLLSRSSGVNRIKGGSVQLN